MSDIQINRADIDSLAQLVAGLGGPAAAKQLLSSIVDAIRDELGEGDEPVTVTVAHDQSVEQQFDTAFAADDATAAEGVVVRVSKVGR